VTRLLSGARLVGLSTLQNFAAKFGGTYQAQRPLHRCDSQKISDLSSEVLPKTGLI